MFKRRASSENRRAPRRGMLRGAAMVAVAAALAAGCADTEAAPAPAGGSQPGVEQTAPESKAPQAPKAEVKPGKTLSAKEQAIAAILGGTTCRLDGGSIDDKGNKEAYDHREVTASIYLNRNDDAKKAEQKWDGNGLDVTKNLYFGVPSGQQGEVFDPFVDWQYPESPYKPNLDNPERRVIVHPPATTSPEALPGDAEIAVLMGIQVAEPDDDIRHHRLIACDGVFRVVEEGGLGEQFDGVQWQSAEATKPAFPCADPVFAGKAKNGFNPMLKCE